MIKNNNNININNNINYNINYSNHSTLNIKH